MIDLHDYYSVIDYIRKEDLKRDQSTIALEYYGNKITRREYWEYVNKYRKYFYSLGVQKGEAVSICMINSPEYEFIFSSLLENGSIASTVSKSFLVADIKRQTIERGIKTLILSVEFLSELIKHDVFSQFDGFDSLDRIILTVGSNYMSEDNKKKYNIFDVNEMVKKLNLDKKVEVIYPDDMKKAIDNSSSLELPKINLMDDVATYSNTGGTTGAPKCVCHTHRAITSLMKSHDKSVYKEYNIKDNSRSLLVIPVSHITSQYYALLLRRCSGANIVYNPNVFDPSVLREELINEKIDDVVLPFGLYYAITRKPFEKGSLKINTPLCGGEPTPFRPTIDVNEKMHVAGSSSIIIGTGSTEFGSGIMASYGVDNRSNESGYFFPYAKGFLLDPKNDSIITEPGKRGILYANAPWQMTGYLNDQKATDSFFNYKDSNGEVYGTNNDIVEIVGEHDGKPLYSMLGRTTDFVLEGSKSKYYPGIKFNDGKIVNVDFSNGYFLFDIRDILLNIEGVMEAQPVVIPYSNNSKEGYPVLNITINPNYDAKEILRQAYEEFAKHNTITPVGIIFRTRFERSLSSDKREVISLKDERVGYYYYDGKDIYSVEIPENGEPQYKLNSDGIVIHEPPAPKLVYSNRKKK